MQMELIVFTTDTGSDDPYTDSQCYKRGDVIEAFPDGKFDWHHHPGVVDQVKSGRWAIINVPDMPEAEATALCVPELVRESKGNRVLQRRAIRLNIDGIANANAGMTRIAVTDIRAMKELKPALADPAIIGLVEDTIIGPK